MLNLKCFVIAIGLAVVESLDDSSSEDSITPVSLRDYTYAKPTTVHKRINVQRIVENVLTSTVDPFKQALPLMRRSGNEDIWSWDFWCHLQPKVGNCSENWIKYYYDVQLDECISFTYSGCGGNKNNFRFIDECQRHCNGAAYMAVKESGTTDFCELQPSAGLCMALIPKYYYDVNAKTCKEFSYGGCGGNQNRFESIDPCMGRCRFASIIRHDDDE